MEKSTVSAERQHNLENNTSGHLKKSAFTEKLTSILNKTQSSSRIGFNPNFVGAGTLGQTILISNAVQFPAAALSPSTL